MCGGGMCQAEQDRGSRQPSAPNDAASAVDRRLQFLESSDDGSEGWRSSDEHAGPDHPLEILLQDLHGCVVGDQPKFAFQAVVVPRVPGVVEDLLEFTTATSRSRRSKASFPIGRSASAAKSYQCRESRLEPTRTSSRWHSTWISVAFSQNVRAGDRTSTRGVETPGPAARRRYPVG